MMVDGRLMNWFKTNSTKLRWTILSTITSQFAAMHLQLGCRPTCWILQIVQSECMAPRNELKMI